ncbi:MAG: MFS transporter [Steroidobacteraceae bacterium]
MPVEDHAGLASTMNPAPADPALLRRLVWLLSAAVFLNYFDRGNLATAAPLLQSELGLSAGQMGLLFSAFFWSYAPLQPLAGWLAQRFDVRHVLAGGVALWSLATFLTGFASGFTQLLLLRALLGIGESVSYPCNARLLAQRASITERGRANGFIATGQSLGPALGTLLGGMLMAQLGWRATFLVFGAVSLLWLLPWQRTLRRAPPPAASGPAVGYASLLRERSLWGVSLGHFAGNYAYYFMLSWLPTYLVRHEGFSVPQMAMLGAAVYAMQAISAPATGAICDRLILRGADANRVLKSAAGTGIAVVALAMAACALAPRAAILAAAGRHLLRRAGAHRWAPSRRHSPDREPPAAGHVEPVREFRRRARSRFTGRLIDLSGQFTGAFLVAAAITLLGLVGFGWVIPRVRPIDWDAAAALPAARMAQRPTGTSM